MNYIAELQAAWDAGGWLAVSGAGIMVAMRGWSSGLVQNAVGKIPGAPAWLLWDNLTPFGKLALVGGVTAIGSAAIAFATGTGLGAAVGAGLAAGLAAIGSNSAHNAHKKSREGGLRSLLPPVRQPSIRGKIGKDMQAPVIE